MSFSIHNRIVYRNMEAFANKKTASISKVKAREMTHFVKQATKHRR